MTKTIAYLLVGAGCLAQTHSVLNLGPSQVGSPDFTTLPHTKPVQTGSSLPSACQIGDLFLYGGGQGMYACTGSANPGTWSPVAAVGGLTYSGAWSSSTTYAQYNIVTYSGSSYVSLNAANAGHEPDTSPTWWSVLAAAGTPGAAGSGGVAGATSPISYNSGNQTVGCATCEVTGNKGLPNGYPALDSTGKVPAAQLPAATGSGLTGVTGTAGVSCTTNGGIVTCQSDPTVTAMQAASNTFTSNNTITGKLVPNDAATGTTQYYLAKVNSSGNAVTAAASDTNVPVFPVLSATSRYGNASLVTAGNATVQIDAGGIAAGHFLLPSTAIAGRGMDSGAATTPASGCWVGIAGAAAAPNANASVILAPGCANSSGVPYAGAAGDLNLGSHKLIAAEIDTGDGVNPGQDKICEVTQTYCWGWTVTNSLLTNFKLQLPDNAAIAANNVMRFGAPVSGLSQVTFGAAEDPANKGVAGGYPMLVATGSTALGTGSIAPYSCATTTASASGVATGDVIVASFNGSTVGVVGYTPSASGMLAIIPYPTAGNVNFQVCNGTTAAFTPGGSTLNWRVIR